MMMNTEQSNIFFYPTVFEIAIIVLKNHSHLYCVTKIIDTVNFSYYSSKLFNIFLLKPNVILNLVTLIKTAGQGFISFIKLSMLQ